MRAEQLLIVSQTSFQADALNLNSGADVVLELHAISTHRRGGAEVHESCCPRSQSLRQIIVQSTACS